MTILIGTITATSPALTVTLHGTDDPLPVDRTWGTLTLTAGDEVRVAIIDGQVEVLAEVVDV